MHNWKLFAALGARAMQTTALAVDDLPPAGIDRATLGAHQLLYTGRTGTLFAIFFKNLALTIITLGLYRFWAKTRERRFLWSSTSIDGEPFEYTGTGKELFIGFLKAMLILVPVFAALQFLHLWLGEADVTLAMALQYAQTFAILVLIYAGTYAARRYRMSRTLWRGIRFRQLGSAWRYVGHALLGLFLCVITLGFYFPYFQTRLLRYETDNLRFGSEKFRFTGKGGEMFGRFVACWLLGLLMFALLIAAFAGIVVGMLGLGMLNSDPEQLAKDTANMIAAGLAVIACVYLAMGLTFVVVGTWYQSKFWRFRAAHTHCEDLHFAMPDVSTGKLMRLLLGNWALMLVSFGLLRPLATQRSMRFWCNHLQIAGTLDFERIAQAEAGPRSGEGLAGFFDIDLG